MSVFGRFCDLLVLPGSIVLKGLVELDDEVYNEEFLAELRETLKALEAQNKFAILIPEIDKTFETS